MNLKCKLCENEALWYCPLVKDLICDGCCTHDMQTEISQVIVERYTRRQISYTQIDKACRECGKRNAR